MPTEAQFKEELQNGRMVESVEQMTDGYEMLQGDVGARVGSVSGVDDVTVEVIWDPIWTTDRLTDRAHEEFRECGIGL